MVKLVRELPGQSCYPSHRRWECQCGYCGAEFTARVNDVKSGRTRGCGCWRHGKHGTSEYRSWSHMKQRCQNPNNPSYPDYGGRGIKVCERWQTFANFYVDMGERPAGCTLDRKDNDGDYCPENCRWSGSVEQNNNRRGNVLVTYDDKTQTVSQWARELGVSHATILGRVGRGWTNSHEILFGRSK